MTQQELVSLENSIWMNDHEYTKIYASENPCMNYDNSYTMQWSRMAFNKLIIILNQLLIFGGNVNHCL